MVVAAVRTGDSAAAAAAPLATARKRQAHSGAIVVFVTIALGVRHVGDGHDGPERQVAHARYSQSVIRPHAIAKLAVSTVLSVVAAIFATLVW
jgi:hypothetical protein